MTNLQSRKAMRRSHTGATTAMTLLLAGRGMHTCSSFMSSSLLSLRHYTAPVSRRAAAASRCFALMKNCSNTNTFALKQLLSTTSGRHPAAPLLLRACWLTSGRFNGGVALVAPPSRGFRGGGSSGGFPTLLSAGNVPSRHVQLRLV